MIATAWDASDVAWLKSQLNTPSGKKLVSLMKASIPKIKSMTKETAWVMACEKQGQETMYETFLSFAEHGEPELREGTDFRDMSLEKD